MKIMSSYRIAFILTMDYCVIMGSTGQLYSVQISPTEKYSLLILNLLHKLVFSGCTSIIPWQQNSRICEKMNEDVCVDLFICKSVNLTALQKKALKFAERNACGIWEKTPANWGCRVWVSRIERCQKIKMTRNPWVRESVMFMQVLNL